MDFSFGNCFQTGDHSQQRGFSAARWTNKNGTLPIFDLNARRGDGANVSRVSLGHAFKFEVCHKIVVMPVAIEAVRKLDYRTASE